MEELKKINLSAMMKKTSTANDNKNLKTDITEQKSESQDKRNTRNIKIDIATIKSKPVIQDEVKPKKTEVIKDEKTLFYESLTSNVLWQTNKKTEDIKKQKKVDLSSIQASEDNKDIEKNDIDIIWKNEKINNKDISNIEKYNNAQSKKQDLFLNYESDYKKKESVIIDTLQKLKKVADLKKMTKTNKVFVVSIIMTTVLSIWFLFHVDPETHSLENYKASILTLAGKHITKEELITHEADIEQEIVWQLNEKNLGWYQLDFEILTNKVWEAIYKFDGLEYPTKKLLDIAIDEKLEILKVDKIKNYFKK